VLGTGFLLASVMLSE